MSFRVAIFFTTIVLVSAFGTAYLVRRLRELSPTLAGARGRVLGGALWLGTMLPLVRFLGPTGEAAAAIAYVGFTTWLACVLSVALLLAVDLVGWLVARLGRRAARRTPPVSAPAVVPAPGATPRIPRREMIRKVAIGASVLGGSGTSGYGVAFGRHDYVLEDVPVRLARLPRALDGYRIAQLSDLHVGTFVGRRELDEARALVRRVRPDLIVLTGDLVDHDPRYLPDLGALARALTEAGARDGLVAILGNHDDYTGADAVTETLRAAGVRVLRNASTPIGDAGARFTLAGVDDVWAARNGYGTGADLGRALRDVDPDDAKILLCHNPQLFPEAAPHVDLQLSGHTHGGQVNPIVSPAALVLPYLAGHYEEHQAQLYVNRGFGTAGPPARIGSAPEVTRIHLVAG